MPNIASMQAAIGKLERGEFAGNIVIQGTSTTKGSITGDVLQAAEHSAGAIGTGAILAPKTYRRTENGIIIKTIKVDITGLGCKGGNAKDAIGLVSGAPDAPIGRYVIATDGICFKIEMSCIELPAGSGSATTDIDLGAEDDSDVAYDGPVDDVLINTAALVAGETAETIVPALTANDYIYLIEGDTAATNGVYTAGQFIIKFYGHPLLT